MPFVSEGRGEAPKLSVYFDQAAPAVDDWTRVHEPSLKRARAFLLVCSPGASKKFGPDEWVHKELEWWVENRKTAPILIDPTATGEGDRWVPDAVKQRWPNAQRVRVEPRGWAQLSDEERSRMEKDIRDRIISGIHESERGTTYEDLEKEKARTQQLQKQAEVLKQQAETLTKQQAELRKQRKRLRVFLVLALATAISAVFLAGNARFQQRQSESRRLIGEAVAALGGLVPRALELAIRAVEIAPTLGVEIATRFEAIAVLRSALREPWLYAVLEGHEFSLNHAAFNPDGGRIVTASGDDTARIYFTELEDLLVLARSRLPAGHPLKK